MKIKALSYNIHKGLNWNNQRFTLEALRSFIRSTEADLVFLQEVVGENTTLPNKFSDWVDNQHEYLADSIWNDYAYSKNAVYDKRHHGNAILSKYPIIHEEIVDLTQHRFEMRALLFCIIQTPICEVALICTHLNLLHLHRIKQYEQINSFIQRNVPKTIPIILAGDFNDWSNPSHFHIKELDHCASRINKVCRTFPHFLPIKALDHFFSRNIIIHDMNVLYPKSPLSDHLPILLDGEIYAF